MNYYVLPYFILKNFIVTEFVCTSKAGTYYTSVDLRITNRMGVVKSFRVVKLEACKGY